MLAIHGGPARLRPAPQLDAIAVLRRQVRQCHADLDRGAAGWLHETRPVTGWSAPARLYVHALCIEDITMQSVLREVAPLFTWLWPDLGGPPDEATLRQYARAVYASTDVHLVKLSADGLSRVVDLTKLGLGRHTVAWVIRRFVVTELGRICGVISCATAPSSTPRTHRRSRLARPVQRRA